MATSGQTPGIGATPAILQDRGDPQKGQTLSEVLGRYIRNELPPNVTVALLVGRSKSLESAEAILREIKESRDPCLKAHQTTFGKLWDLLSENRDGCARLAEITKLPPV